MTQSMESEAESEQETLKNFQVASGSAYIRRNQTNALAASKESSWKS